MGAFEVSYRTTVDVRRPAGPAEVKIDHPGRLPLSILNYILPSRYCESDRFAQQAWDLFGKFPNRADQVREICRWVDAPWPTLQVRRIHARRRETLGS